MKIKRITTHKLFECEIPPEKWETYTKTKTFDQWLEDEDFRERWIAFDDIMYNPNDGLIYVGLTALNGDIFYTFDPSTGEFRSLGFPTQGDAYATKIHNALTLGADGCIYGAVATLADVDVWERAPGGHLFRYDPASGDYELLGIPMPHEYIQCIRVDEGRGIIYGSTFPGYNLFRYDMADRQARQLCHVGAAATEHLGMDADGGVWHNYHLFQWAHRFPLLRYDPDRDAIDFLNLDLPDVAPQVKDGTQMDATITTRDGTLYIATVAGGLARIDHRTPAVENLGRPSEHRRAKIFEAPDGEHLFIACGVFGDTHLFAFHRESGRFSNLGPIVSEDGTHCWQAHEFTAVDDHTLYIAECDNHERASYLFQVDLADD
jgi:hypothetical protein